MAPRPSALHKLSDTHSVWRGITCCTQRLHGSILCPSGKKEVLAVIFVPDPATVAAIAAPRHLSACAPSKCIRQAAVSPLGVGCLSPSAPAHINDSGGPPPPPACPPPLPTALPGRRSYKFNPHTQTAKHSCRASMSSRQIKKKKGETEGADGRARGGGGWSTTFHSHGVIYDITDTTTTPVCLGVLGGGGGGCTDK